MTGIPVVFLAFANSSASPIPRLSEEDDSIYQILHQRSVHAGHFHLHRESHADLNKLRHFLSEYRDQVFIFHYAGHTESEQIFLPSGEARASGLSEMLAEQSNLKLVFLNGCSSAGQVENLIRLGIPAVIATRAPINDTLAKNFARHFYHALEMGANIRMALGEATAFAKAAGKEAGEVRAFNWETKDQESAIPEDLWAIFHHPEKADVLESKLPGPMRKLVMEDFSPNETLINTLWQSLLEGGVATAGRKVKLARKRMDILNNLPAPVAENLRKLLVPLGDEGEGYDVVGLPRLKQLAKNYQVLLEMLTFTLLAQLWEAKYKNPALKLPETTMEATRAFLQLKEQERETFRFIPFIRQLRQLLDRYGVEYFVEELNDLVKLMAEETPFRQACMYFDLLRGRLAAQSIVQDEYYDQCQRAEQSLSNLFRELGYLTRYTLATIKHIDVEKYRHTPKAHFRHVVVRLLDLLGGMEEEEETLERFLDNRSVLLLKEDEEEIVDFLNLSPFIIDENAFVDKTDKSKIFFLNYFDSTNASWCYEYVNNPNDPVLRVSGDSFQIVKDQLEAFEKTFF